MNVFTFSGRVGQDAELKTTQSGEKVLGFSVANDIGFGDRRKSQWIECSYWGKRAEAVSNYIKKGDRITVSGEVQLVEFQRRDGTPGSKLAVRVNDLDLASRSAGADANPRPSEGFDRNQNVSTVSSHRSGAARSPYAGSTPYAVDRPLHTAGRPADARGGGGGTDYGSANSSTKHGGGKPAFDQDLDDEVPFVSC